MSARSDLIAALAEHSCCFSDEDAKKLVEAYAHALAEKQRAWLDEYIAELGETPKHQDDITEMIDLIDPKAPKP